MFDLLYKELRLAAHPSLYVFMLMGALLLVPAYPYGFVFFFGTLGIFQTFCFGRETGDVCYTALLSDGNPAGIEANAAYYGFGLAIYGLFNLVFFAQFYRTAYKSGAAFLAALFPTAFGIALMETLVHLPGLAWLDGTSAEALVRQLPVLAAGAAIYLGGTLWAYATGVRRFEQVNL